jgi:hypothetical protein
MCVLRITFVHPVISSFHCNQIRSFGFEHPPN